MVQRCGAAGTSEAAPQNTKHNHGSRAHQDRRRGRRRVHRRVVGGEHQRRAHRADRPRLEPAPAPRPALRRHDGPGGARAHEAERSAGPRRDPGEVQRREHRQGRVLRPRPERHAHGQRRGAAAHADLRGRRGGRPHRTRPGAGAAAAGVLGGGPRGEAREHARRRGDGVPHGSARVRHRNPNPNPNANANPNPNPNPLPTITLRWP
mmetsp:Transcript_27245/g.85786  ORF Transcript_27245/g.85786 Transcript_27245/m.85786 type:complete len:207 (+) Transcript_27245:89-709(+)